MSEIISFPNAVQDLSNGKLKFEKPAVTYDRMIVGAWNFTCPHCNSVIKMNSEGLVFRKMEFYCSSCNNFSIVTNPAFSS